jgi:2-polyprenyl-3-methyl-5-hydroxy-6-metoxy-1,4-benzoquinol methylase
VHSSAFDQTVAMAMVRYSRAGRLTRGMMRGKLRGDPVYRELLDRGIAEAGRIVDLGCGRGLLFSLILAARGDRPIPGLYGVEVASSTAHFAREALRGVATIVQGDLASGTFPQCDVVTILDVAHYLPTPIQDDLWARVRRALPVEGRLFVREADASGGAGFLAVRMAERIAAIIAGDAFRRFTYCASSDLIQRLESAGFSVLVSPMGRGTPFSNVLLEARARA